MTVKVFLVGGAVRDLLLGIEPKDFDFVVVGANPQMMIDAGFEQVGADFPVFLNPHTGDEFALARTERKVGEGHTGFECDWEGVTLEEDLSRRDLTINAMAIDIDPQDIFSGKLPILAQPDMNWSGSHFKVDKLDIIDPFGGRDDLERMCLRHVSDAFAEDPLRILRIGRFLSRFGEGSWVKAETMVLVRDMINAGMLEDLTPERVWKEAERALMEPRPDAFFKWLWLFDANICPELDKLFLVPQRPDFHPEGDAGIHTLLCLEQAAKANLSLPERFAVLCHDFGKHPAHIRNSAEGKRHLGGHEAMGLPLIDQLCDRWKVPNDCRKLAKEVAFFHTHVHNLPKLKPKTVNKMFKKLDILRHPERVQQLANCCVADARGRGSDFEDFHHVGAELLPKLAAIWSEKVDVEPILASGKKGDKVGEAIDRVRLQRLQSVKINGEWEV